MTVVRGALFAVSYNGDGAYSIMKFYGTYQMS